MQQVVSAPTRSQIDRAHAQNSWADVGVQRIRNLRWVGWPKIIVWTVLCLSSMPLHLLWNSAVFSTAATNSYAVSLVSQNATSLFTKGRHFEKLDQAACIKEYTQQLISDRRDVGVVVADSEWSWNRTLPSGSGQVFDGLYAPGIWNVTQGGTVIGGVQGSMGDPFDWICGTLSVQSNCGS